ncbi:lamin tail domain-containing protein [Microbacterium sp. CCNWLW134]|uniref:lamin tail domain-containing protein n=1 Tax=Microbacterium sp. CCNWLW134 TaxID=3122064 RepID=UPI00300F868C
MRTLVPLGATSLLISILLAAFPAPSVAADGEARTAAPGDVVISEITHGGPGGPGGAFFELHNTSAASVSLRGWSVFRCDEDGLRAKASNPETPLDQIILESGERFVVAQMTAHLAEPPDAVFSQAMSTRGLGLVLVGPDGEVADDVAAYPSGGRESGLSECGDVDVPVALAWSLGESWQRTADGTWIRGPATPGAPPSGEGTRRAPAVEISEIAAAGPGGHGDDVVELHNAGEAPVDVGGWRLYRCTALGEASGDTLQHLFAPGRSIGAGERVLIAGPEYPGTPDIRTDISLADLVSGALLVDDDGRRVDGVTVSAQHDTACQTGPARLDGILDHRSGQSWQKTPTGDWLVAGRTPGLPNATVDLRQAESPAPPASPGVALSEVATDPALAVPGIRRHAFVELGNYADTAQDISGWRLIACTADGFRAFDDLATVPAGTILAPGETWVAVLAGTDVAGDATFDTPFALHGAGVWVEDDLGRRVDSVGIYHRNEMDESVERVSPCTNGLALATFAPDRLRGETYQRTGFTGSDIQDFVVGVATPGVIDRHPSVEPASLVEDAVRTGLHSVAVPVALAESRSTWREGGSRQGAPAEVRWAFSGSSPAPLATVSADGEVPSDDPDALHGRDDGYDLPYVRFGLALDPGGGEVRWSGRVVGRSAVALSVWQPGDRAWRLLDKGVGDRTAAGAEPDAPVVLSGVVDAAEVSDGAAQILVQVVPRTSTIPAATGLADPQDYDLALSHITDTQYLSESYPEVYAAEIEWILANAESRKIDFAIHTGDLIQSWVDPDQREARARHEFEIASQLQAELDAQVANSVLPGNHDNKRGLTNDLFNEYFGPDRYADAGWYGGSIAPGDNRASWSAFTADGARFVVVSLPYAYGEPEVAWAEDVVAAHPDANVVIATHEHVTPKGHGGPAARSNSSRWLSHADMLWERVIAPNRNVVLVLSGHFHGIGAIVTEDAGGIPGHTVVEAVADYQEFRTPTGERATGFQRLLQIDLAGGMLAVDTFSVTLDASASHPFDYTQFVPDNGTDGIHSNERPWNVLDRGLQNRYTAVDDEFAVPLSLQYPKGVHTAAVTVG